MWPTGVEVGKGCGCECYSHSWDDEENCAFRMKCGLMKMKMRWLRIQGN